MDAVRVCLRCVVATTAAAYVRFASIAVEIEEPFGNDNNDIDLTKFVDVINDESACLVEYRRLHLGVAAGDSDHKMDNFQIKSLRTFSSQGMKGAPAESGDVYRRACKMGWGEESINSEEMPALPSAAGGGGGSRRDLLSVDECSDTTPLINTRVAGLRATAAPASS